MEQMVETVFEFIRFFGVGAGTAGVCLLIAALALPERVFESVPARAMLIVTAMVMATLGAGVAIVGLAGGG